MNQTPASQSVSNELEEIWPDLVRFSHRLTGNGELAEDLAQESMVRALQSEYGTKEINNLRAWLCRIALNVFREWWRKRARESQNLQQFAVAFARQTETLPQNEIEHRERLEQVWAFIQGLPTIQRQVMRLHIVEGLSHSEIAKQLNTTNDNIKSNLSHVRRKLRERFLQN